MVVVLVLFLAIGSGSPLAQDAEYSVKAAFLFNFLKFVQFPEDALAASPGKLVIGVLGSNPFDGSLEELAGKSVKSRSVEVTACADVAAARRTHILFISKSEKGRYAQVVGGLKGAPTLTVADGQGFLDAGGMIEMFVQEGSVKFKVNLKAAHQSRLQISSQMLVLAVEVLKD